jgi:hypothetical protein
MPDALRFLDRFHDRTVILDLQIIVGVSQPAIPDKQGPSAELAAYACKYALRPTLRDRHIIREGVLAAEKLRSGEYRGNPSAKYDRLRRDAWRGFAR